MGKQIPEERRIGMSEVGRRLARSLRIPKRCPFAAPFLQEDYPEYTSARLFRQAATISGSLGVGAFGVVSECRLEEVEEVLALKRVKVVSEDILRLCIREFEVMRRISHPNILRVYRLILDAESRSSCLFMDFILGKGLDALMQEKHPFTGTKHAEDEVKGIARQLFSALAYLESIGLAHRDIHPGNVLISEGVVTLLDFQTCVDIGDCHGLVGTTPYQAPEMWNGLPYDCKVDVWSAVQLSAICSET